MGERKTALIVTDGTEKVTNIAKAIAAALKGKKVLIKDASAFAGTDLLPAEILFFGCEEPSPPSFGYLDEMLRHINLAGRVCGVFSPSSVKAVQYLNRMLKSSGVTFNAEPLIAEKSGGIKEWAAKVI